MEKFLQSLREIQDEYDLTDEGTEEAFKIFFRSRSKTYFDRLAKKYPISLIEKAFAYIDTIPKIQWQNKTPEQWIFKFASDNPKKLSSKELAVFFDKETGKPMDFVHNPFNDEIYMDGVEAEDRNGETWVREKPRPKPQPPKLKMPSQKKIDEMDSGTLGKLIDEARSKGIVEE